MANDSDRHLFEIVIGLAGALFGVILSWLTRVSEKVDRLMEFMAAQKERNLQRDREREEKETKGGTQ